MVNAFQDNDWYLGGGLGLSYLDPETNNTGYRIENDKDRGWKMYLGYDLNQSLSIEAYYADMGEADMAPNGRIGYVDYGLSGIYYFRPPLLSDEGLSAFARLGVGRMKNDTDLDYPNCLMEPLVHPYQVRGVMGGGNDRWWGR